MKTLQSLIILITVIGWIVRYYNYKKGKYSLNMFDEFPTFKSVLLFMTTITTFILIAGFMIEYLP